MSDDLLLWWWEQHACVARLASDLIYRGELELLDVPCFIEKPWHWQSQWDRLEAEANIEEAT